MKKVAIIIPAHKPDLSASERIALNHLNKFCSKYELILVCPEGMCFNYDIQQFTLCPLPAHHFNDINSYSRLCMNPMFYQLFSEYEYILIYQLDAYVFKDELINWCNKNYSYIGAPWYKVTRLSRLLNSICKRLHIKYQPTYIMSGVGNGGLSLRNIKDMLDVLTSTTINWLEVLKLYNPFSRTETWHLRVPLLWFLCNANKPNFTKKLIDKFKGPEDNFYHLYAKILNKHFTFPATTIANQFSFDHRNVKEKMRVNNHQLPFGAHNCFYDSSMEAEYRQYFTFIEHNPIVDMSTNENTANS